MVQQIFSRVCAKLDLALAAALPSRQDLHDFVTSRSPRDEAPNFDVILDEKDGEICFCGSWEDIATVQVPKLFYIIHPIITQH